jgi:hypothetical protein
MSTQQVCSLTYQRGFLNIAGNLSLQSLTTEDNISPFTASFAPRNTAPTLLGTTVDETNQNTILYNSYRYMLVPNGAQFCQPTNSGMIPQSIGGTPEMEFVLTFYTTQSVPISEPKVIILSIPIFSTSSENKHAAYVRQFIDSDKNPVASLQTIFFQNKDDKSQSCLAYNTSVQLTSDLRKPQSCLVMRVFYFPNGIRMTGQDFYAFKTILTKSDKVALPQYMLPSITRNSLAIASTYDGASQTVTGISSNGTVLKTQVTIAEIGNKLEYFKQPPQLTGGLGKDFDKSCPYYKTTEYKCVPFHRLTDLSGNEVIKNAYTLDQVMKEQDQQAGINTESSVSVKNLFIYLAIIIGIVIAIVGLGMAVRWLSSAKPPGAGPVVAASSSSTAAPVAAPVAAVPVAAVPVAAVPVAAVPKTAP